MNGCIRGRRQDKAKLGSVSSDRMDYHVRSLIRIAKYAVVYAMRRVAVGVAMRNAIISSISTEDSPGACKMKNGSIVILLLEHGPHKLYDNFERAGRRGARIRQVVTRPLLVVGRA